MNTDSYIKILSSNPYHVTYEKAKRRLLIKLFAGIFVALFLVLVFLGIRPDWREAFGSYNFWLKQAFPCAVAVLAARELIRSAYPVPNGKSWLPFVFLIFLAVEALGVWSLLNTDNGAYLGSLLGSTWKHCSYRIIWIGLPSMVLAFWAIKQLAPTDLNRAGACAGLFGGAVGASVYALHCSEKTAPFVAVWYVAGMMVPAIIGWIVGPRALRW
ncbi:Anti-sigma-F factor NrsF [Paraburkholderia nemoris]|uniref:NrsF family protein n=1 Tax=Paraburkholderia nemoris TaxID=2793076 RepID=UPI00190ACB14|nr:MULTISPECIES: DUF1109 domain-containing protein [Paraburkholderia]MBK3786640.1 DUF1109 domain-containing protein [Paraburkholderia aspalathi]MBK5122131.1 DUF1109 domain-containing protein [Burkholderia sp. R-69980]CAE6852168.1 Anti-sigma-F factor NrsF [Paraburkholderia nemoris]